MPTIAEQLKEEGRVEGMLKGIEKGVEKGELIGQIRELQGVLGETVISRDELMRADIRQLRLTAKALASRVSKR